MPGSPKIENILKSPLSLLSIALEMLKTPLRKKTNVVYYTRNQSLRNRVGCGKIMKIIVAAQRTRSENTFKSKNVKINIGPVEISIFITHSSRIG